MRITTSAKELPKPNRSNQVSLYHSTTWIILHSSQYNIMAKVQTIYKVQWARAYLIQQTSQEVYPVALKSTPTLLWCSNWIKTSSEICTSSLLSTTKCTIMKRAIFTLGAQERWDSWATQAKSSPRCPRIAKDIHSNLTLWRSNN